MSLSSTVRRPGLILLRPGYGGQVGDGFRGAPHCFHTRRTGYAPRNLELTDFECGTRVEILSTMIFQLSTPPYRLPQGIDSRPIKMIKRSRLEFSPINSNSMSMRRMGDKVTFGHYRVLQRDDGSLWELGRSAMGVTYKALDTDLQRPVALKVINSDFLADEVNRDRFLREARAAAGLRHSQHRFDLSPREGRGAVLLCNGVHRRSDDRVVCGALWSNAPSPALLIAWQVSKALAAAARQQLVHRDIKPANIMIVADSEEGDWPFVKLIDFSLPRSVLPAHDSDGTTPPGSLGIAQSRSPEQIEEGNMDARSDIYSLGCTLWYLLTGEAPFTGSPTSDLAQRPGRRGAMGLQGLESAHR